MNLVPEILLILCVVKIGNTKELKHVTISRIANIISRVACIYLSINIIDEIHVKVLIK